MGKGIHILAELDGCENSALLINKSGLEKGVRSLIDKEKLNIVGVCSHQFEKNQGVTLVFLLAESHVSVHTWPEKNHFIHLDIFVCNFTENNEDKARNLLDSMKGLFIPSSVDVKEVMR